MLHDICKPKTRTLIPGGGVSFHHHEIVGARLAKARLKALRFDNQTIEQVENLVALHLRFHGYGDGEWTDSAVRRYVRDAGDLLVHLHVLTRADCTTRNIKKADKLSKIYDGLEERIEKLMQEEELSKTNIIFKKKLSFLVFVSCIRAALYASIASTLKFLERKAIAMWWAKTIENHAQLCYSPQPTRVYVSEQERRRRVAVLKDTKMNEEDLWNFL